MAIFSSRTPGLSLIARKRVMSSFIQILASLEPSSNSQLFMFDHDSSFGFPSGYFSYERCMREREKNLICQQVCLQMPMKCYIFFFFTRKCSFLVFFVASFFNLLSYFDLRFLGFQIISVTTHSTLLFTKFWFLKIFLENQKYVPKCYCCASESVKNGWIGDFYIVFFFPLALQLSQSRLQLR